LELHLVGHTVKQLQKIIQRTIYAGVRYEEWNTRPVWTKFAERSRPVVSIEVFNKANRGKVIIRVNNSGNPEVLYNQEKKIETLQ
jgi:hypothetical protein